MTSAPPRWQVVETSTVEATPWRNGGGVTRELLRLRTHEAAGPVAPVAPGEAAAGAAGDDWLLRISVADIAADGPFSSYPGVERCFAVLSGAGVALDWNDAAGSTSDVLTPASTPLRFDGEQAPGCRLLDGPTRDLNVMARRRLARARLERAQWATSWQLPSNAAGVFACVPLELSTGRGPVRMLPAQTLAWCEHAEPGAWTIAPPGLARAPKARTEAAGAPPAWWIALSPVRLPAC